MNKKILLIGLILSFIFTPDVKILSQKNILNDFIQLPSLKHASISIKIVDVSTGKSICAHNENMALIPASCMKLVSTATALETFGEDFTYKTIVFTDGSVDQQGTLKGNIYVQGVGDPTLGSAYLGNNPQEFLNQ